MLNQKTRRIAIAYLALQAVIWAKCALFFALFGHGKSMLFSLQDFPAWAIELDFFFHNAVHFLIGVLALLFGASMRKIELRKLAAIVPAAAKLAAVVAAAVAVHNVGYWFTATHPGIEYTAFDFARDSVLLFAAVAAGYALNIFWKRFCNRGNA